MEQIKRNIENYCYSTKLLNGDKLMECYAECGYFKLEINGVVDNFAYKELPEKYKGYDIRGKYVCVRTPEKSDVYYSMAVGESIVYCPQCKLKND